MVSAEMQRILVTGALGQIGSELTPALRERYGDENVVAADVRAAPPETLELGPFVEVDVTDRSGLEQAVRGNAIDSIVHLAAILSASGERAPELCWRVNVEGLKNVLDLAADLDLTRVFVPSSIAVFGPATPKENVPQDTVLGPTTMYGVTKVTGEMLGEYYVRKHGVDCRGLRYPGIISYLAPPGGGTTDYAVAIFHEAVRSGRYNCFVREDTVLPMMYMPDAIKAAMDLLEAPADALTHPCSYNVAAMSFPVGELAAAISRHVPDFACTYEPDERQAIADSWPRSIDDTVARHDWGWHPDYDLERMVADMLSALRDRVAVGTPA